MSAVAKASRGDQGNARPPRRVNKALVPRVVPSRTRTGGTVSRSQAQQIANRHQRSLGRRRQFISASRRRIDRQRRDQCQATLWLARPFNDRFAERPPTGIDYFKAPSAKSRPGRRPCRIDDRVPRRTGSDDPLGDAAREQLVPKQGAVGPAAKAIGERTPHVDPEFPRLGVHVAGAGFGAARATGTAKRQATKTSRPRSWGGGQLKRREDLTLGRTVDRFRGRRRIAQPYDTTSHGRCPVGAAHPERSLLRGAKPRQLAAFPTFPGLAIPVRRWRPRASRDRRLRSGRRRPARRRCRSHREAVERCPATDSPRALPGHRARFRAPAGHVVGGSGRGKNR